MVNYARGKVYAIRSHKTDKIYIGSTCRPLANRMSDHRSSYRRWKAAKLNKISSYEVLEHGDAYIELLESYPCGSKEELNRREGQLIRKMNCVNRCIAGRTRKQRYQDNRTHDLERQRRYDALNRERIKQRKSRRVTCECGVKVRQDRINHHRKTYKHTHQFITWA